MSNGFIIITLAHLQISENFSFQILNTINYFYVTLLYTRFFVYYIKNILIFLSLSLSLVKKDLNIFIFYIYVYSLYFIKIHNI